MREVGVLEAKTHLSSLLDEVERGEELAITRHGKVVAHVVGVRPRKSGAEIAAAFRRLQERIAAECGPSEDFDWKAAVDEGRE